MSNPYIDPDLGLLQFLDPIIRARNDRLYSKNGNYFVDLWKEDGRYLLGRRPTGVLNAWKNQMEKGMGGQLPGFWTARLKKLLKKKYSWCKNVLLFSNSYKASLACEILLRKKITEADFYDPLQGKVEKADILVYRPLIESQFQLPLDSALIWPILPAGAIQCQMLLLTDKFSDESYKLMDSLISDAEAAGLCRAIANIERITPQENRIWKDAINSVSEISEMKNLYSFHDMYGYYTGAAVKYEKLFQAFLKEGFLLPPDFAQPMIIPMQISSGEIQKLHRAFESLED